MVNRSTLESSNDSARRQIFLMAFFLALVPATAVGFGRFAYAVVLPAMKTNLGLSYAQSGALGTGNTVGYLLGAILTSLTVSLFSMRKVMIWGFISSAIFLLLAGLTQSFALLMICRFGVGFASAFCNIAATGLAAQLGRNERENALALGIAIAGPGLGVAFSGITIPFLLEGGNERWQSAWLFMGAICAIACLVTIIGTKGIKDEKPVSTRNDEPTKVKEKADFKRIMPSMVAYFGFGLGYIAYMTFLIQYVRSLSGATSTVALTWGILGMAMVSSPVVWRHFLTKSEGGLPLFLMGIFGGAAALLPLLSTSLPVLLVSAVGFGVTSMAVFTAVTLQVRRHLPESAWTMGIGVITSVFASGQSLGPLGAGTLADHFGPSAVLWWTAGIMSLGGTIALLQKQKNSFTD
jgi:predicted MFS family arabinose efflux permease